MVTQYGMSELGPIQYGRGAHQVFLGRDFGDERNYSEEIASKIDGEVRKIIETCYENGKRILNENWAKVERMVASLLEYETVDAEEVTRHSRRPAVRSRAPKRSRPRGFAERAAGRRRCEARREAVAPATEHFAGTGMKLRAAVPRWMLARRIAAALRAPCRSRRAAQQQTGALPRGGTYVLDPDPTIGTAAIGLWFRAPGAGYDNASPGIARLGGDGRCSRAAGEREIAVRTRA